jgi:hypothetical protein
MRLNLPLAQIALERHFALDRVLDVGELLKPDEVADTVLGSELRRYRRGGSRPGRADY